MHFSGKRKLKLASGPSLCVCDHFLPLKGDAVHVEYHTCVSFCYRVEQDQTLRQWRGLHFLPLGPHATCDHGAPLSPLPARNTYSNPAPQEVRPDAGEPLLGQVLPQPRRRSILCINNLVELSVAYPRSWVLITQPSHRQPHHRPAPPRPCPRRRTHPFSSIVSYEPFLSTATTCPRILSR